MKNRFSVSVSSVNTPHATPLVFEVETHDDLLETVERVRNANIVSEGEAPALAIGLKLLGEVIIRHRDEPQFAELWNVVPAFIKRLKAR